MELAMLGVSWAEQRAMPKHTLDNFIAMKDRIKAVRGGSVVRNPLRDIWESPYDSGRGGRDGNGGRGPEGGRDN